MIVGSLLSLAAEGGGAGDFDWISQVITWGPPGVVVVLLLTGVLEPKRAITRLEGELAKKDAEVAHWRSAFEAEQTAHQRTRDALAAANERAAVAVENGRTTALMLQRGGHMGLPTTGAPG